MVRVPASAPTATAGGVVLLIVGLAAYVVTDFVSLTALIPAVIGAPLVLAGVLARDRRYARPAAYAIAGLGLVAVLGALMGFPEVIALIKGEVVESRTRAISQAIMVVVGAAVLAAVVYERMRGG